MIEAGNIVVFRFPRTDLKRGKLRPALLVKKTPNTYNDWLVCLITTKRQQLLEGFDDVLSPDDADFLNAGIREISVVRVTRPAIVHESVFEGVIGSVSLERQTRIRSSVANWIR